MPFGFDLRTPDDLFESQLKRESPAKFIAWLVPEKTYILRGQRLATLVRDGRQFAVTSDVEAALLKYDIRPGDIVLPNQRLAFMAADGELLPYGRNAIKIEPLDEG